MKNKLFILSLFVFTMMPILLLGQSNPVTINVQLAPPFSSYISDYQDKAILSFTNRGQTPLDIYIRGRIENDRGEYIQTKPNIFSSVPVHVPAMQTVVVIGNQLDENYLDLNNLQTNLSDEAYTNLFRLGLMPEGFYTFCIYAYTRDANGNYIPVSDQQSSGSCFAYNVGYVVPPRILSPLQEDEIFPSPTQNVNISWTRPVGNMQNAMLAYDLYMVKVLPGEDPQVSLNNAVEHGAGIFFKQSNIQINNFQFTNLTTFQLEDGNDYALMVQARDLTGKTAFENNGRSEISSFTYGFAKTATAISEKMPVKKNTTCSCVVNTSSLNQTNNNNSLKAGGSFTIASLTVQIGNIKTTGNTVSGDGTVLINKVPVQISFSDVVVNKDGIAIAGNGSGREANGFDFLNNGGGPPVLSTANYNSFLNQIKNYNLNAIKNGAGIPLPFGLNKIGAPDEVNIGITSLNITPQQATYDAIAVVQLADANSVLALAAKQVCFSNASLMCGDAVFVLDQDFEVPAINLKFKSYQSETEPGTYVIMSENKMKQFHINAEYGFPTSLLTKYDGSQEKAVLDADADSWSDWTASVTMEPFKLPALSDILFELKTGAFYDHSTLKNPDGMPLSLNDADLSEKNAVIGNPLWTGFFIPSVSVSLPSIIKNINRSDDKLQIAATNLILDKDGLTGVIGANNILSLGDGSLGGWYCSLDQISIKFLNSSYKTGGLYGKLVLPFSDKNNVQSQIDYSCTLSSLPGKDGLTYELVAAQKNNIDLYAWWAHFNINNSSIKVTNNNSASSIVASADLSGKISLDGNIDGNKIDLNLIEVEHFVVQTQEPYVRVESAKFGLSSPQHLVAWFPVNITKIKPVITGRNPGLQFDLTLFLSDINNKLLPTATTTLTVSAEISPDRDRPIWKPYGLELNKVSIEGNLGGLVNIKEGTLEFFHDDPTFGDGIYGALDATFTGLDKVEVATHVKFGNKSFNYWYFDASSTFPPVPVAPGISIDGFGGGAYYNLKRTANDNISAKDYFKNMAQYQVGAFVPQAGSFGFKAKVGVSTNDGFIFTGWAEIGATFNTSGGFSLSSIDGSGSGQLLKSVDWVKADDNASIQGAINWHIGIADKVYNINGAVEIKEPPVGDALVQGNGWFDLMADIGNNNYYLKVGDPEKQRVTLSVADLLDFKGYFMAGNQINASIPDPDPAIVDVSKLTGYQKLNYDPEKGGLVMGASMNCTKELDYLIFYLKVSAGIGFDIDLARYTQGCNGSGALPGLNGWYGLGQVYAGFKGEMGLDVDLFFYSGRVKALDVYADLVLRGGLPNPYWFDGYAQFGYDVFDGAIAGDVNFHISIGDKCVPEKQVFSMPLVEELKPADQTINVPLNAYPEVVFNYPAEKQFDLEVQDEDGANVMRSFRLNIENCTVTNIENNSLYANYYDAQSYPVFTDNAHKDLMLGPDEALLPQTRYKLDVSVKAQELNGSDWKDSYYQGAVVEESHSTVFKTGDCKLDEYIASSQNRLGAYPFPGQRYFLPGESKQGAIILDRDYVCAGSAPQNFDLLARFTAIKNHAVVGTYETPLILNGGQYLNFDIPPLPKECVVRVEIIKRSQLTANDSYVLSKSNVPLYTAATRALSASPASHLQMSANQYSSIMQSPEYAKNVKFTSMNNNHALTLSKKTIDIILYSYHFRTSQYNTLSEKMNAMYYSSTSGYSGSGAPTVNLMAVEKFDSYDVNGFVSNKYKGGSTVYFSLPLVTFKETSNFNRWMLNHELPCVYQSIPAAGFTLNNLRMGSGISYQMLQHTGIACVGGSYCVPLRPIDIASYDPILSQEEINADEVPQYIYKGFTVANNTSIISNLK